MGQIDQARALLRLGAEDTEEGRTAAWQAAKAIAKHGFALFVKSEVEELQRQLDAAQAQINLLSKAAPASGDDDWSMQVKIGITEFAKQTIKTAGFVMPEIVYTRRKTRCNQCGNMILPNIRMSRHPKKGLRCIPCARKFL